MAAQKFLQLVSGKIKEVFGSVTSTANALVAMDSTGHIDVTVLPTGVGPETQSMVTSENLTAGNFVNVYSNSGVLTARKADATTNTKPAHGFVLSTVTSPAAVTVYLLGNINSSQSSLTIGSIYYLDTTAGGVSLTPPSASGNIVQEIGIALTATTIPFENVRTIEVA